MSQPQESPQSLQTLKQECHRLIEAVARRPGAAKLLLGTLLQLQMFAAYKVDRRGHNGGIRTYSRSNDGRRKSSSSKTSDN